LLIETGRLTGLAATSLARKKVGDRMIAGTRHGLVVSKLFDASTEGGLAQSTVLSLSKYKPPRLTMRQRTTGGRVNMLFWFSPGRP
jgi:hypothetical protein